MFIFEVSEVSEASEVSELASALLIPAASAPGRKRRSRLRVALSKPSSMATSLVSGSNGRKSEKKEKMRAEKTKERQKERDIAHV